MLNGAENGVIFAADLCAHRVGHCDDVLTFKQFVNESQYRYLEVLAQRINA
jgi:hypothetical protein